MISASEPASGRTPLVIKRYVNRRLYDTGAGRYVTVEQLRALSAETEVLIFEAETGADITRALLALH